MFICTQCGSTFDRSNRDVPGSFVVEVFLWCVGLCVSHANLRSDHDRRHLLSTLPILSSPNAAEPYPGYQEVVPPVASTMNWRMRYATFGK